MRFIFLLLLSLEWSAEAKLCDSSKKFCGLWPGSSSPSTGAPTRGSKVRINPAAVPTEKSLGLETIIYKGADFTLVKGLGRVGAGISPANSEQTFFGPPGVESDTDFLERSIDRTKFPAQKYSFATALNVYNNKKDGLQQFDLNLGVLAKYNRLTKGVLGGAGIGGKLSWITYGYSRFRDQTQLASDNVIGYEVETFAIGLFLNSLALDYSILNMKVNADLWTTRVYTASLLLKKTILTLATRHEESNRKEYDSDLKILKSKRHKYESFGGVQVNLGKYLMGGVFYNYYLLHEISFGITLFF